MDFGVCYDAWSIAAGAIEPPPLEATPDELRQAASILLALPRLGLSDEFWGGQPQRLEALGANWRDGARLLPVDPQGRQQVFQTIFGARKRAIADLGLDPVVGLDGKERDPLPRSRSGGTDRPEPSAVRRFVNWALSRGLDVEFLEGPLAGTSLADLREVSAKELYEALDGAEPEWLSEGASVRLFVKPIPIGLTIPPGRDDPFEAASCSAPRGCTQTCPMFGMGLCQYRSGCGWDTQFHSRSQDHRRADQMPRRPGLPYTGGFGEHRR